MNDDEMPFRCWCGRSAWDGHTHFGLVPVEFGRKPKPPHDWHFLLMFFGLTWLPGALFLACS